MSSYLKTYLKLSRIILVGLLLVLFNSISSQGIMWPIPTWQKDTPENHGLDSKLLEDAAKYFKDNDSFGFLVIKDGYIVYEEYWNGWDENSAGRTYSLTKSITGMIVAKAYYLGTLDIENYAADYISEWIGTDSATVQIKHLLRMDSGREYDFWADYIIPWGQSNITEYAIGLGQDRPPGEYWVYNNMAFQCLERVILNATGKDIEVYGEANLFRPLGFTGPHSWDRDMEGNCYVTSGIRITLRDVARLAYLLMNGGNWNGTQLLDPDFISKMLSQSTDLNVAYGYAIWVQGYGYWRRADNPEIRDGNGWYYEGCPSLGIDPPPMGTYSFLGHKAQCMIAVPDYNLIIVRFGKDGDPRTMANEMYCMVKKAFFE